jgi:hypothetical protein
MNEPPRKLTEFIKELRAIDKSNPGTNVYFQLDTGYESISTEPVAFADVVHTSEGCLITVVPTNSLDAYRARPKDPP